MTITAPAISWDGWRAAYDTMSFADQQKFYDRVFDVARVQSQHSPDHVRDLLDYVDGMTAAGYTVAELGGWDGQLAASMLAERPATELSRWTNYEISRKAVAASACSDPRYSPVALDRPYWHQVTAAAVFVASHVLEHLRFDDVRGVFDTTWARWLYLDVPVGESPRGWDGYHGSHILEVGWADLEALLAARGYRRLEALSDGPIRCYER